MNEERLELLEYLKTLSELNKSGFKCGKEITDVLESLHKSGYNFSNEEAERERRFEEIKKKLELQVAFSGSEKGVNHGKLIRVSNKERALGKTTLLINLSLDYNIPIVVGSKHLVKWTKDEAKKMYGENTEVSVIHASESELAGRKFPNGVLVDCQINLHQYLLIKKWCLIRGGFYHDKEFI